MLRRGPLTAVVLAGVVALAAAACSGEEGPASDDTVGPATTVAAPASPDDPLAYPAYSDPGTPIVVGLGRRFALQLEARPGEGFSWQLAATPDPAVVVPLGSEFRSDNPGIPGSGVVQYLSFAASGLGDATIDLAYVSPGGQPSADTGPRQFRVTVTLTGEPPPPEPGTTVPAPG